MALSVTVHGITVKTGTQTSGRLGTANITTADGLDNVVYTVPSTGGFAYSIVAVSVCNRESSSADNVSLAVCDSNVPKDQDFVEWNTTIVPNGVLERTQLMIQPGQRLVIRWGQPPAELVPDHEIADFAGNWTGAVTGTGVLDTSVVGRATLTLAEGDTGTITTSTFALTEGNTYRATVSFYSTDVTGENSSIKFKAFDGDIDLVSLGIEDRNATDQYRSYSADFTVDNATQFTDQITQLQVAAADVNLTLDRISLKQIA